VPVVEAAFAFALTVAAVAAVLLAIWVIVVRRRNEVHIAPFEVAGEGGESVTGVALANMLRARLVQAQREAELRSILSESGEADPAATLAAPLVTATAAQVRGAVDPVDIDFSVGTVSVGGLLAWAQRWALERQTLRLTVVFADENATVSGTLEPFGVTRARALWSTTLPNAKAIVDGAADAIVQSRAADVDREGVHPATALGPSEFGDLLWCLNQLALHERRTRFGQSVAQGVATLDAVRGRLAGLIEAFPNWEDLNQLAQDVERRLAFEATPSAPQEAPAPPADEAAFLEDVADILHRLFPDGAHPNVVIGEDLQEGLLAMWNSDARRYECNPMNISDPGFALQAALLGRLMMKNFDRCGGSRDVQLWNDYRQGVVEFLASTDPEIHAPANDWLRRTRFFGWLERLDARQDVPDGAARELAFRLLDSYDCGWTWQDVRSGVQRLNSESGEPVPPEALKKAVRGLRAPSG